MSEGDFFPPEPSVEDELAAAAAPVALERFALAIPHTPWVPERVRSLTRLAAALATGRPYPLRIVADRTSNAIWSGALWTWLAESGADYCVQLQDDALVAPNFWRVLEAMVRAVPDQVIGLEAAHPGGKVVAREEGGRWYTTADGLIGVGYVFPRALLESFLRWRREALKPGALDAISEDTLIGVWAVATGRRIWHPVPTIIDHDVELASTYANDEHPHRRPSVTWQDGDVAGFGLTELEQLATWVPGHVPHLGRFYPSTARTAALWSRDFTVDQAKASDADVCPDRYARFFR